jgi:hypothetical protein
MQAKPLGTRFLESAIAIKNKARFCGLYYFLDLISILFEVLTSLLGRSRI